MKAACLLLCLIFLFLTGCTTQKQSLHSGNPHLTDANIQSIKVGMVQDEILNILGEPDETESKKGHTEWIYRSGEGKAERPGMFSKKTSEIQAKILVLQINPEGSVIDVFYDALKETDTRRF